MPDDLRSFLDRARARTPEEEEAPAPALPGEEDRAAAAKLRAQEVEQGLSELLGDQPAVKVGVPHTPQELRDVLGDQPGLRQIAVPGDDEVPQVGVDVADTRRKILKITVPKAVADFSHKEGRPPSKEELAQLTADAREKATNLIHKWRTDKRNINTLWVDMDPDGTTDRLAQWNEEVPILGGAAANVAAWLSPYTYETFELEEDGTPKYGHSDTRQGALGWLAWLGQGAPTTVASTMMWGDAGEWAGLGSREQIHAIRQGKDILSYSDKTSEFNPAWWAVDRLGLAEDEDSVLDAAVDLVLGETDTEQVVKNASGVVASIPAILLEPDAIALATFGLGKLYKGGKAVGALARAAQFAKKAERFEEAATVLSKLPATAPTEEVGKTVAKTLGDLRKADPLSAKVVDHVFRATMAQDTAVSGGVYRLMSRAQQAEVRLAGTLHEAQETARASEEAVRVVKKALEAPYKALTEAADEAAKHAGGLSDEAEEAVKNARRSWVKAEARLAQTDTAVREGYGLIEAAKQDLLTLDRALRKDRLSQKWAPSSVVDAHLIDARMTEAHEALRVAIANNGNYAVVRQRLRSTAKTALANLDEANRQNYRAVRWTRAAQEQATRQREALLKRTYGLARPGSAQRFAFQRVPKDILPEPVLVTKGREHGVTSQVINVDRASELRRTVAEAELRAAMSRDLLARALHADLEEQRRILMAAGQGRVTKAAAPKKALKKLRKAYRAVSAARRGLVEAGADLQKTEKAREALAQAQRELHAKGMLLAEEYGASATAAFGTLVGSAKAGSKATSEHLARLVRAMDSDIPGLLDTGKILTQHARTARALKRSVIGATRGRAAVPALQLALRRSAQSYRALANTVRRAPPEGVDVAGAAAAWGKIPASQRDAAGFLAARGVSPEVLATLSKAQELRPTLSTEDMQRLVERAREMQRSGDALRDGTALARSAEARRGWYDFLPAAESVFGKTLSRYIGTKAARVVRSMTRPSEEVLGPGSDEVLQIGKGMLDTLRMAQREIIDIADKAPDADKAAALVRYATGEMEGAVTSSFAGGGSVWSEALSFVRAMDKREAAALPMVQAIGRAWLFPGEDAATYAASLEKYALELMLRETPPGLPEFLDLTRKKASQLSGIGAETLSQVEQGRAVGYIVQGASALATLGTAAKSVSAKLSGLQPKQLDAVVDVAAGRYRRAGPDLEAAFSALDSLGLPVGLRTARAEALEDLSLGLVRLNSEDTGGIIPRAWMSATSTRLGNIVKSTEEFTAGKIDPQAEWARRSTAAAMRAFNTSLTAGLILPIPRYFFNMVFGNTAQMWAEHGLGTAIRVQGQTAAATVRWASQTLAGHLPPVLASGIDDLMAYTASRFNTNSPLASISNALFNPHVSAFFDPALAPASTKIRGKGGREFTMGELRQMALQEGVLTTFVSEGLLNVLGRTGLGPAGRLKKGVTSWMNLGRDAADWAETRQRVALWTDLVINQGVAPKEAGRITRNALYDWGHASTSYEAEMLHGAMLFMRFWRLALGRGVAHVLSPAVAAQAPGVTGGASKLFAGQLASARVRHQGAAVRGLQETFREDSRGKDLNADGVVDEEDELLAYQNELYPWWTARSARPLLRNVPMDAAQVAWWREELGQGAQPWQVPTHEALTMPALTPLDVRAMLFNWAGNLAAVASGAREPRAGMKSLIDGAAGRANPVYAEALEGLSEQLLPKGDKFVSRGTTARRYEKVLLGVDGPLYSNDNMPLLKSWVYHDKSDPEGVWRMDPLFALVLRTTPVLGTELNSWLEPLLESPLERRGYAEGAMRVLRQWTGVARPYEHSPAQQEHFLQSSVDRELVPSVRRAARKADYVQPVEATTKKAKKRPLSAKDLEEALNRLDD